MHLCIRDSKIVKYYDKDDDGKPGHLIGSPHSPNGYYLIDKDCETIEEPCFFCPTCGADLRMDKP